VDSKIGQNVRDDADQGPEFEQLVTSIEEAGQIYVPINALAGPDGIRVVTDGQRRILAARRVGLATVPVRIVEDNATNDKQRTVARVTEQIITSEHRKSLTTVQKAKGVQELLMTGLTPNRVSKSLGFDKAFVAAAAKVVKSGKALAALDEGQLTIEQATALIEFEDDDVAVEYLKQAASEGQFEHRASELRKHREDEAAYAELAKPYAQKGFTILPYDFEYYRGDAELIPVDHLSPTLDPDNDDDVPIEDIEANPQAWAVHISNQYCYVDIRNDTVIGEELIDSDADDDDEPAEGLIHPKHTKEDERYLPDYYCVDKAAAGLYTWDDIREAQRSAPIDDSEYERTAAREAARQERQKASQLNRLGEAAQVVRRAWVRDRLLSRKTPPKGAAIFVAQQLTACPHLLLGADRVAADLLGIQSGRDDIRAMAAELADNADPRATVIILGLVLGAMEAQTSNSSWRSADIETTTTRYLRFLVANGYEPAPVEQIILGDLTADELFAQSNQARADTEGKGDTDEDQDRDGSPAAEPTADENAAKDA
jgi:ParB family transcriptional regulator, chromosome partitioning protein